MTPERVHHPAHYGGKDNPYECLKVMEHWAAKWIADLQARGVDVKGIGPLVVDGVEVLRYLNRFAAKDPCPSEHLRKAKFYLDRMLERAKGIEEGS